MPLRPHPATTDHGSLTWLNGLPADRAAAELVDCCAAAAWVDAVTSARPFRSLEHLLDTSAAAIAGMDDAALDQALSAHARIGERRDGAAREDQWSRTEQAAALEAGADVAALLARGNREYEQRFGRVFLIRAAGRDAQEMYAALQERLGHDADTERHVVLRELADIVELRLTKLVSG